MKKKIAYLLAAMLILAVLLAFVTIKNYRERGIEPTTTTIAFTDDYCRRFTYDECPDLCEVGPSCPACLDIGCHAKGTHAPTTTTIQENQISEEVGSTTTIVNEYNCKITRSRIKSYGYKNGDLTVYFQNVGSSVIYNYDLTIHRGNEQEMKRFYNLTVEPRETERFDILEVGRDVTNITVTVPGCELSHTIEVHEVN